MYDEKNIHKSDDLSVWLFLSACDTKARSLKYNAKIKKENYIYVYRYKYPYIYIYIIVPFM